jgi:hypothetical protein
LNWRKNLPSQRESRSVPVGTPAVKGFRSPFQYLGSTSDGVPFRGRSTARIGSDFKVCLA